MVSARVAFGCATPARNTLHAPSEVYRGTAYRCDPYRVQRISNSVQDKAEQAKSFGSPSATRVWCRRRGQALLSGGVLEPSGAMKAWLLQNLDHLDLCCAMSMTVADNGAETCACACDAATEMVQGYAKRPLCCPETES